jgi:hypothetical protein
VCVFVCVIRSTPLSVLTDLCSYVAKSPTQPTHASDARSCVSFHLHATGISFWNCLDISHSDLAYYCLILFPLDSQELLSGISNNLPAICDSTRYTRDVRSGLTYRRYFAQLPSAHRRTLIQGSAGSAYIYDCSIFCYRLHSFNSVFTTIKKVKWSLYTPSRRFG